MVALLAIGPSSIPTLEKVCQHSNDRQLAVLIMAKLKETPLPWFSSRRDFHTFWKKDALNGKPLFGWDFHMRPEDARAMAEMLEHPDPAVRRASAEALGGHLSIDCKDARKSAVPWLMKALNDANQDVRNSARLTLQAIDPVAAATAGIK